MPYPMSSLYLTCSHSVLQVNKNYTQCNMISVYCLKLKLMKMIDKTNAIWVTSSQNQQNLSTKLRLRSSWPSTQTDQSKLLDTYSEGWFDWLISRLAGVFAVVIKLFSCSTQLSKKLQNLIKTEYWEIKNFLVLILSQMLYLSCW